MELTRLKRSLKNSPEGREPISGNWKLRAFEWDLVSVMSKIWQSRRRATCAQKVNHLIKRIKAPNLLLMYEKCATKHFLSAIVRIKNAKREIAFIFEYAENAVATSAFALSIVKAWNDYFLPCKPYMWFPFLLVCFCFLFCFFFFLGGVFHENY